jgi:predicted metal-dependent peptidase
MSKKKVTYSEVLDPIKEKELVKNCKDKIELTVGSAIKYLFDEENSGKDFYAHLLMQMDRIYDDPRIPTAAVSVTNKITLYINSKFFVHTLAQSLELDAKVIASMDEKKFSEAEKVKLRLARASVIEHEVLHVLFQHIMRGQDYSNHQLGNIAADLVVNSNLVYNSIPGVLYPQDFKLPKDETMDYYYKNFPIDNSPICQSPQQHDQDFKDGKGQEGKGQGKGDKGKGKDKGDGGGEGKDKGEGSGQGEGQGEGSGEGQGEGSGQGEGQGEGSGEGQGQGGSGGSGQGEGHAHGADGKCKVCGGVRSFDNHDIWSSDGGDHVSDAMKDSLIKDAINRAASATKNAGNLPQSVQAVISVAKQKAQVPWQVILRQFVSKLSNSDLHHTKKRLSKRFHTRPGIKLKPKLKLGVGMDVSGSISEDEYKTFLNEIFAIAKHLGEVEIVEWDTKVQGHYKIKGYKPNITRSGAGGTDPTEAIKWFNDRKNQFDGLIMFTDGHLFSDVGKIVRLPCLWVVTADGSMDSIKDQKRKLKLPKAS